MIMERITIWPWFPHLALILFINIGCRDVVVARCNGAFPRTACGGHDNMFVFGMSCYRFVTDEVDLATARSECESEPGFHLVFIQTIGEQSFLSTKVDEVTPSRDYWIGIEKVNETQVWMDGSEITYSSWGVIDEGGECVRLKKGDMLWHDRDCTRGYGYICERKIDQTCSTSYRLLRHHAALDAGNVNATYPAQSPIECAVYCARFPGCGYFSFLISDSSDMPECMLGSAPAGGAASFIANDGAKSYAMN